VPLGLAIGRAVRPNRGSQQYGGVVQTETCGAWWAVTPSCFLRKIRRCFGHDVREPDEVLWLIMSLIHRPSSGQRDP